MRRPVAAVLARPKSRIFRVQSDFTTMLLGFRSCPDQQHKPVLEEAAQDVGLKEERARHSERPIPDDKHTYLYNSCTYVNSNDKILKCIDSVLSDSYETDFILVLLHMNHPISTGRLCPPRNKRCNET